MPIEYVLKSDGKVMRRPFSIDCPEEREIAIDEALFAAIPTRQTVKLRNAFPVLDNTAAANVCFSSDSATGHLVSVQLPELILRSPIRTVDTLVIPSFDGAKEVVELKWEIPGDMHLMHCTHAVTDGLTWTADVWYLFGFYDGTQAFQLPLPNLYNDCHLCTGHRELHGTTLAQLVNASLDAFRQSQWTSHLIDENHMRENSQRLFNFKSTPEGFRTVHTGNYHWTQLSRKVGTDILSQVVL